MQSIFRLAPRRTTAAKERGCGVAARVGEKWIGLNRCPDASLWGLNGGRCRWSRGDRYLAAGQACHGVWGQPRVGIGESGVGDARAILPRCDVGWRHTSPVTRAGRRCDHVVGARGCHGVRRYR